MSRHPISKLVTAALLALSALAAHASDQITPPPQRQALLITGATLHTVSGAVIEGGSMLVERGRIRAISAPGGTLPAAETGPATVLDLRGRHIYPGFIAANSSLGLVEVQAVRATVDTTEIGVINPNVRALVAVNADSELLPVARSNGVLAALAVPGSSTFGSIAGTSALLQIDGWTWEDMALVREVGLHVVLPLMRTNSDVLSGSLEPFKDEVRKLSAQRLQLIDQAFEAASAYARARAAEPNNTPQDQRWEAMLPVMKGERMVFVHADDAAQIRHALGLAERFGLKLVIVGGADAARFAPVLKARGVAVVIAGVHNLPQRRDDAFDARYTLAAQLAQAGVVFCIAGEGGAFAAATERNLPYQAATAVAHGLPGDEALKAITLYPAQILGVADRLGALAPGLLASFIVTDGDPLETATHVERIFIQGREVDTGNRQRRLEQKYQLKPPAALPPVAAGAR
jgi:imidazolonepropionase-like amidohydrolase